MMERLSGKTGSRVGALREEGKGKRGYTHTCLQNGPKHAGVPVHMSAYTRTSLRHACGRGCHADTRVAEMHADKFCSGSRLLPRAAPLSAVECDKGLSGVWTV